MIRFWRLITRPPWRTIVPTAGVLLVGWGAYLLWQPGLDIRDGHDDLGMNGIWIGHGWCGGDDWFVVNGKKNEAANFRNPGRIRELASLLRNNHITDVFPHLCPSLPDGRLPAVDAKQVEQFLDIFQGFRVIMWIGGHDGEGARLNEPQWRAAFTKSAVGLITAHPRLAGVQVNIEPVHTGDTNYLQLLDELRIALPKKYLLSVAAYPPPTIWHPFTDVHWNESYFRAVARRSDQLVVMTYDAAQRLPKTYQYLMVDWTREILAWSENKPVLIGIPTYKDTDVSYHHPEVENITNALLGIHRGLAGRPLPPNYQGVAIYCEWETTAPEWQFFQAHFLNENMVPADKVSNNPTNSSIP